MLCGGGKKKEEEEEGVKDWDKFGRRCEVVLSSCAGSAKRIRRLSEGSVEDSESKGYCRGDAGGGCEEAVWRGL